MRTLPTLLATFALVACGGKPTTSTTGPTPPPDAAAVSGGDETPPPHGDQGPPRPTVEEARAFVQQMDADLRRLSVAQSLAEWAKQTDITDEHEQAAAKAGAEYSTYLTRAIKASRRFDPIMGELDPDTRRQIMLLRLNGQPAPDDPAQADELALVSTQMDAEYGKGKVCTGEGAKQKCQTLADLEEIFTSSRDPKSLLAAWKGWHDTVGHIERPMYIRFVELANAGARGVGFKDVGEMWRSGYDMPPDAFIAETERLWGQVEPLYKQLHCYTRRKLSAKYGKDVVPPDGPIPAHLLGNMWAQEWTNIYPELEPYKGKPSPNVTKTLKAKKYTPEKMVKLAESFFTSLGFDPLPATFWERSMFVKPPGKEAVCHASAWDPNYNGDVRIKMCIKVNHEDLVTIHHELGHNYYQWYYRTLPMVYQSGAHDGFHEAIGDTLVLSVTPDYLKKVGLLTKVAKDPQAVIDYQLFVALDKVAFLPWGLLVDRWRWDVFAGKVGPDQYNQHWWDLRLKYQGVAPPVPRAAEDFDPGAKYHVPGNTAYTRYFLSYILQFQFHRALCKKAGHQGPLHECSIYGSKEAGEAFKAMLAMGASKPWPDALEAMTGERQMDASAMLEYFAPLMAWLEEQNKGQQCGW
jgi:peptidyl-dipeptidase A